jgi:hypothetical protein
MRASGLFSALLCEALFRPVRARQQAVMMVVSMRPEIHFASNIQNRSQATPTQTSTCLYLSFRCYARVTEPGGAPPP